MGISGLQRAATILILIVGLILGYALNGLVGGVQSVWGRVGGQPASPQGAGGPPDVKVYNFQNPVR